MSSKIVKEKLIRKGAEANLYYGSWFGSEAIFKHRVPKKYRLEELDKRIRTKRTLNEARALIKVKNYGLNCPQVYEIDVESSTIVMKYIKGEKLKDILDQMNESKKVKLFKKIGCFIAKLHVNGHVHGDITTSNMIITENDEFFLIDFGLHDYSDSIEDKSVDLHLFKRVLVSSHGDDYETCYAAFLDGYKEEYSNAQLDESASIIKNMAVIETRGRYVKKEDRM
jgi:TP53 regulating kinase-like protein